MINMVPVAALQTAVYQALSNCITGYPVYDDSTPFVDGKLPAKNQCIIGPITAVPKGSKADTMIWETTITIELYSDYCGKKVVNEMMNDVVYVLTAAPMSFDKFELLNRAVDLVEARAEDWNDDAIWQHGSVRMIFTLEQKSV